MEDFGDPEKLDPLDLDEAAEQEDDAESLLISISCGAQGSTFVGDRIGLASSSASS